MRYRGLNMSFRIAAVMMIAVALVLVSAGCDDAGPATAPATRSADGPLRIALIPKAVNLEYWKSIHAGAIKAQRELEDVVVLWKGASRENDREQQIAIVENFVNARVSGIVIAPLDETALVRPLQEAVRAGIPVVIMDSDLRGEPGRDYVSYVATDNAAAGRRAARHMGELLGGRGRVIVMRYQVGSGSTALREDGFLAGLAECCPDVEVVSSDQYAGPTTETGMVKAENLLNRYPDVDGIFCACEPIAWGLVLALRNAGRAGRVKVVAFDPSSSMIEALQRGEVHGLVLQDPLTMGETAVRVMVEHLRGRPVESRIDTGSEIATLENMHDPLVRRLLRPPIEAYLR